MSQAVEDQDDNRDSAKSLQKALALLQVIGSAELPMTIADVAIKTGVSRPTAYRLVRTLVDEDFVRQDPQTGRLMVGLSVLTLAANLLDSNLLRLESLPHLQSLSRLTGERSNLGIIHRNRVLYLAGVEKPTLPTLYSRFGKMAPAHCCSLGKAILAHLPAADVELLLRAEPLVAQTPESITSRDRLFEELERVRQQGYATDVREHMFNSCCISAAIFDGHDHPVGAIGVSGREIEPLMEHLDALRRTAELISHTLQRP